MQFGPKNPREKSRLRRKVEGFLGVEVSGERQVALKIQLKASRTFGSLLSSRSFSNQSAAEKMSLEDEIRRCKVLLTSAARRSRAAQVNPS